MSSTEATDVPVAADGRQSLLDLIACIETATRVSCALALMALGGRALTFLIDGPSSLRVLLILFVISFAAFVAATMSRKKARTGSVWNARFSGMAQRIGIVQMVVGTVTVVLALT